MDNAGPDDIDVEQLATFLVFSNKKENGGSCVTSSHRIRAKSFKKVYNVTISHHQTVGIHKETSAANIREEGRIFSDG
jgi:hypothetical protein